MCHGWKQDSTFLLCHTIFVAIHYLHNPTHWPCYARLTQFQLHLNNSTTTCWISMKILPQIQLEWEMCHWSTFIENYVHTSFHTDVSFSGWDSRDRILLVIRVAVERKNSINSGDKRRDSNYLDTRNRLTVFFTST